MDGPGAGDQDGTYVTEVAKGALFSMTMTSSCPERSNRTISDKLSVIEHTYPGWRIRDRSNGMWSATRIATPTPTQAAAGLHAHILQPDLDALAAVLCQQLYIVQTVGVS